MRMRLYGALFGAWMLSLVWVSAASAVPDETAFTLDSQVAISFDGGPAGPQSITLDPIPLGPPSLDGKSTGIDCLAGVCDVETQDWVAFRVSVLTGNLGELTLSLLNTLSNALPAVGLGYFFEGGPAQPNYSGSLTNVEIPQFLFAGGITGQSLALFVAFADGSLPQSPSFPVPPFDAAFNNPGAVRFMVSPSGSASIGSELGAFATPINVIPEPTTALLLGLGIAALATRKGRRQD